MLLVNTVHLHGPARRGTAVAYEDLTLSEFLSELGSASPAPGGGSAAALAGACAAALCEMVCRLTLGKEAFRDAWPAVEEAFEHARELVRRLLSLVDDDAQAYLAVVAARAMPRETPDQKAQRKAAVKEAVVRAASVPLETLDALQSCARLAELLTARGNPSCITDVGTAGALVRAGGASAAYNVRVNLPSIGDESLRERLAGRAAEALTEIEEAAARIARYVENSLAERRTK
jgi:formiminotetrahydrofolate cyclodeaminase